MSAPATAAIDAALARWLDNEPAACAPIRDDILAALAAAGYVVERGWQPIESAPRDRCVLLWWPTTTNSPVIGRFDSGIWMTDWGRLSVPHDSPTHWRPLPDPPAAEAEAKETE